MQKILLATNVEKHRRESHFIQANTSRFSMLFPTWEYALLVGGLPWISLNVLGD